MGSTADGALDEGQYARLVPALSGNGRREHAAERHHESAPVHRRNVARWATLLVALAAGCGGPPRVVPTVATGPTLPPPPDPTTIDAVFILESGGPPADDTTITVTPGQTRVLLLRRGPPDNSLFATLTLSDSTPGGRPTRVHVRPRPGQYAVDLEAEGPWPSQATLSMSYALHFVAPAGSRERFGNDLGFERALFLARAEPTGRIEFLRTARPGSDLLQAAIPGPGRYIVAAPRN